MNLQTTLAEFANHSPAEHEQFRADVIARMRATEPYSAEIIDLSEALRKRNDRRTAAYGPRVPRSGGE
jgi:hypothetical protein